MLKSGQYAFLKTRLSFHSARGYLYYIKMVKPNSCLKRCFLALNVIIGIIGVLILAVTLFGHGIYHVAEESDDNVMPGLIILYVIGGVMLVLSLFGAYAGQKEKKWALILFCIGTSLLCLTFLGSSVQQAVLIPKLEEDIKAHYKDKIPLDKSDLNTQKALENVQKQLECCGLEQGYQDWGETVPETCLCPDYAKNSSKCIEVHFQHRPANDSEAVVYSEPCIPLLVDDEHAIMNIFLGITFGLAIITMIQVVISVILLCQTRRQVTSDLQCESQ
ncbi:hypothetical protein AAFF_G00323310 [Aldrovandia affinis]|uniref:Tetraspanin n=1 Tax=Aldrovandia affinis TaxID=143900 RepID=A0AAD7SMU5_9TELE|nr:hypothetical protein AAFF_G00323310 [Aldrovandia affinis]